MIRILILHCRLTLTVSFCLTGITSSFSQITYDIGEVDLGLGYEATGTITTDGTLGNINITNIDAWAISVTGPIPFFFDGTTAGASITTEFATPHMIATLAELSVLDGVEVSFRDNDNSLPDCTSCQQVVEFDQANSSNGVVKYSFWDFGDLDDLDPDPSVYRFALVSPGTRVIATLIPEPTTFTLTLALAALSLACRLRR